MSYYYSNSIETNTQNELLLNNLMDFYSDRSHLDTMMHIINGDSNISLRIIDWFVTNYAKMYDTIYEIYDRPRFKVYNDYKLKLKAYSKRRFDPFCRWKRINIPYDNENYMVTTIGQLNFFKWAIEHSIIDYIEANYDLIEDDMNERGSNSSSRNSSLSSVESVDRKTRKKREELSVSACKCIKKENVNIVVKFT